MNFLSSFAAKSKVKYISSSLIGVSVVAGITCEELSGAKIVSLFNQLGSLISLEGLSWGGQEFGKEISAAISEFGKSLIQGATGFYQVGMQVYEYFPRIIEMVDGIFKTGMKYSQESDILGSKWGSVYSIIDNDSSTIFEQWITSLSFWKRLSILINIPWKIIVKLKTVEFNSRPPVKKQQKSSSPTRGDVVLWTRKEGICWECFGIVLLRPRKSLRELKRATTTWIINR